MQEKTKSPFDQIKSFSEKKEYDYDPKAYTPYVINRALSFIPETVLHANLMNINHQMDGRWQYDYYFHALTKRKRYSKWLKKTENSDVEVVREYFGFNITKAREALRILSEEQLETIKKKLEQGGLVNE